MRILFVSANAADAYIDIEREHRTLQRLAESGCHKLYALPAAEIADVRDALTNSEDGKKFDVFHFSGHATEHEGLHLRGENRRKAFLDCKTLKSYLEDSHVKLIVLNACNSEALAVSLSEVVPAAIGTTRKIRDVVARQFTRNFYGALMDDVCAKTAFDFALQQQKQSAIPAYMHAGHL